MIETTYTKEEITTQLNKLSRIVNGYYSDIIYDAIQIIEKRGSNMKKLKIYYKDGTKTIILCDKVELNRIVDELLIFKNDVIIGRFTITCIAGYIIEESEELCTNESIKMDSSK